MQTLHHLFNHHSLRMGVGVFATVLLGIIAVSRVLPFLSATRAVVGTAMVIIVPGLLLSYVFFPEARSVVIDPSEEMESSPALDWIERITLSIVLSLSVVPLLMFVTNRLGLPITPFTVGAMIGSIILLSAIYLIFRRWRK